MAEVPPSPPRAIPATWAAPAARRLSRRGRRLPGRGSGRRGASPLRPGAPEVGGNGALDTATGEPVFAVAPGQKAAAVKRFRVPVGHGIAGLVPRPL